MKVLTLATGAVLTLSAVALAVGPASANAKPAAKPNAPAVCWGTLAKPGVLAGTYHGDVEIHGVCAVNGGAAVVDGNLILSPWSALNATFALNDVKGTGNSSLTVRGNVWVQQDATLAMGCLPNHSPCSDDPNAGTGGTLTGSNHVEGDIRATDAMAVIVHASKIDGNVTQTGGGGGTSCAVPTTGIFSVIGSPVFSDYEDNTIWGDLKVSKLTSCWFGALRDHVGGSADFSDIVMGDPDANEIHSNDIEGNLACYADTPAVQYGDAVGGVPNKVGGWAKGQCGFDVRMPNPAANPTAVPPTPAGPLTPISVEG